MAIKAGANVLGLVADMPSGPGVIKDKTIAKITAFTPPGTSTFLLTSLEKAADIAHHVLRTRPTAVQVVRHLPPSESQKLRSLLPLTKIVQVVHVENEKALDLIDIYTPHVDAFLLDSGKPSAQTPLLGGTGTTHDWAISAAFVKRSLRPVFLAGGLNAGNASRAIREVRPYGLDLCSSVRTSGRLDPHKLEQFISAVRNVDNSVQ